MTTTTARFHARTPRRTRAGLAALVGAAVAGAFAAPAAADITVTRADTFNPGFFWSTFTYGWTITATAARLPFNDYEVTNPNPAWVATLDMGSHTGPGAIGGPQPAGGIRVVTANPAGFANPVSGTITTNANPKFVAGPLTFQITLNGNPVNTFVVVARAAFPGNASTVAGSPFVAYPPGTFPPGAPIDLFQTTNLPAQDAHIGWGQATPTGAVNINLTRPLDDPQFNPLMLGIDGQLQWQIDAGQCYPDCNGDQLLDLADFGCFLTSFATQNPYADCNGDQILDLADFDCFQTKFAIGCN